MRSILQALISGVCVDGGHQATLNAEGVVEDFRQRSQAVGGAGCVRNNMLGGGVVLVVVHAHHEGAVNVLTGGGNNNFLCASVNMRLRFGALGEEAGGFEHYVNAEILPGKVGRVALSQDFDFLAIYYQRIFLDLHLCVQTTHDRIVLEQVS